MSRIRPGEPLTAWWLLMCSFEKSQTKRKEDEEDVGYSV